MLLTLILSSVLTFVELNCENLFDTRHDSLKQDYEFLPGGARYWTKTKYWNKLNNISKEIISTSEKLPDLLALCEVENDTVLHDLTRRSLLRNAGYDYLMTESGDLRGIDVALLYQPTSFLPLCYEYIRVPLVSGMRPTRDILYVKGLTLDFDTLHVFIVHAPSRYGGEKVSRPYRMQVSNTLCDYISTLGSANTIVAGDFNDYATSPALLQLEQQQLVNVTKVPKRTKPVKDSRETKTSKQKKKPISGNYRYQGEWHSLDHILVSPSMSACVDTAYIHAAPFLLEEDTKYGGFRPRRTFQGYKYQRGGYSDHLPLVVKFRRREK